MTFPQVAAVNGGSDNSGTDHTVNLPADIASGDLLLAFFSTSNTTITFPSGWIPLFDVNNTGIVRFACYYRIADGAEDPTITVTTLASVRTAHTTYRITGYSGTPEVGTTAIGSSATPDPPSLTPSWGVVGTLWVASCGYGYNTTISAYPTNYTNGRNDNSGGGEGHVGTARRELAAASEDPGAFTLFGGPTAYWVANTVAIQPKRIIGPFPTHRPGVP